MVLLVAGPVFYWGAVLKRDLERQEEEQKRAKKEGEQLQEQLSGLEVKRAPSGLGLLILAGVLLLALGEKR